jgi:hypothetical protein
MTDESSELIRRARRLIADATDKLKELSEIVSELTNGEGLKPREQDKYGEPTWAYMVKVRIPVNIYLTRKFREYAVSQGFNEVAVSELWNGTPLAEGFVQYFRRTGKKNQNWTLTWENWVRNANKFKSKPAGPVSRFDRAVGKGGR